MHELSLITSMIAIVQSDVQSRGLGKVKKITLEVGEFSGALPHALKEAFSIAKNGTILENAVLDLRVVPATARCKDCNNTYKPSEDGWTCPHCQSHNFALEKGMELQVVSYTVETAKE